MSSYRFSPAEKFGVWDAHDGTCFWCGEPIEYRHATIDHILPESLEKSPGELSAVLNQFGLEKNFAINSFKNWVPAHSSCNSRKNATVFKFSPVMIATLEYASRRASRAERICAKVEKDRSKGRIIATLEDAKTEGLVTKEDVIELFKELHPEPTKRVNTLRISSRWSVVHKSGDVVFVTDGIVGGYTTNDPNPDPSFLCPYCHNPGPWNGIICLSCNQRSDPSD
jgi:hypothetical protein